MKLRCWMVFVVMVSMARGQAPAPALPQRPIPAIEHVLIISVDGLRPDRALLANMPTLRSLIKEGSYTFWARTTAIAITLPSHTSMVTGVSPHRHGIMWNSDIPLSTEVYPNVPTIFELATKAGYTTALIAGKSKFSALNKPGTVTYADIPASKNAKTSDLDVTAAAVPIITEHKPDLIFVHYPDVDSLGHARGWGSADQLAVIEKVDGEIARLLVALQQAGIRESTLIIVTADHGGAGKGHGPDDVRSRHIPWIASGPGTFKGFDLTQHESLEVRTEDTAATTCWVLGLPIGDYFEGKPVKAAFQPLP